MTTILGRRARTVLGLVGAAALAGAVLLARPLSWSQLFLLLFGLLAVLASSGAVQRALAALVERSRLESPGVRSALSRRPSLLLLYAIWFALITSAGEMAYWTYTKEISKYRVIGFDYMWLIPLGNAVVLAGVGLAFVLVARRRAGRFLLPALVFVCGFILLCAWLLIAAKGLYPWAAAALAAGAAAQLSRISGRHPYLYHLLVRRTTAGLLLAVCVLGAGFFAWPRWKEHRALAQLPAAAPSAPNVILIVLDTVGAESMSLYGYARQTTPNLDRLAQGGVVFERAISSSPWTLPSHGTMFTGRFPHELSGAWMTPIDTTHPTVAETFARSGRMTAGFVANLGYCLAEFGVGRGFIHYEDEVGSLSAAVRRTSFVHGVLNELNVKDRFGTHENFGRKSAERISGDFLRWLSARRDRRPYFAFLNYFDAHAPYLAPEEFIRKFSPNGHPGNPWARPLDAWSPEEILKFKDAYDGSIAYLDSQLGLLFAELERQGELRDTVVIVTSDHGEQFGEHGLMEHSNSLYLPLLHVPLIVVSPGRVPAGIRAPAFVSLRDLAVTMLDLAGVPNAMGIPGESLSRHWNGPSSTRQLSDQPLLSEVDQAWEAYPDWYPARRGRMKSLLFGGLHYIRNYGNGREELYDVLQDPKEMRDLATVDPARLEGLRNQLEQLLRGSGR